MTPRPPERYRQLASSGTSDELMATIEALGPEEQRAASAGLDTAIPALTESLRKGAWLSPLLVVLLLVGSPRQLLRILARGGHWLAWELHHHPEQLAFLARVAVAREAGCVADSGRRHESHHVVLLDELIVAHDLALPVRSSFWRAWLGTTELAVPRPQRRWQEHYLTACRHPDAFSQLPQEPSLASDVWKVHAPGRRLSSGRAEKRACRDLHNRVLGPSPGLDSAGTSQVAALAASGTGSKSAATRAIVDVL